MLVCVHLDCPAELGLHEPIIQNLSTYASYVPLIIGFQMLHYSPGEKKSIDNVLSWKKILCAEDCDLLRFMCAVRAIQIWTDMYCEMTE